MPKQPSDYNRGKAAGILSVVRWLTVLKLPMQLPALLAELRAAAKRLKARDDGR